MPNLLPNNILCNNERRFFAPYKDHTVKDVFSKSLDVPGASLSFQLRQGHKPVTEVLLKSGVYLLERRDIEYRI